MNFISINEDLAAKGSATPTGLAPTPLTQTLFIVRFPKRQFTNGMGLFRNCLSRSYCQLHSHQCGNSAVSDAAIANHHVTPKT